MRPASENEFCADLQYLIEQTASQFAELKTKTQGQGQNNSQLVFTDAKDCRFSLGLNSSSYQCFWKYEIAGDKALAKLELLRSQKTAHWTFVY